MPQPFPLVLGRQAAADLHLRRDRTGFGLANPKLFGEQKATRQMREDQSANRPAPGTAVVTDKGLAGADTGEFFAGPDLGLVPDPPGPQGRETTPPVPELAAAAG